jgi:hypothetical protein
MEIHTMGNMTIMSDSVDFADTMKTEETAKLLWCSGEQVRQLTARPDHPLPFIDIGAGRKRQRLFRRSSVLRWMIEEEERRTNEPPARTGSQ